MVNIVDHFLFYSDQISKEYITLAKEECHHLSSVLKIGKNSLIFITDGAGHIYTCTIENLDNNSCKARIINKKKQEQFKPFMHFLIGLPTKDAFEEIVKELIPLGVQRITPIISQHCQKNWLIKKWDKQYERLYKKMIAATKQSWNVWLPQLDKPMNFNDAILLGKEVNIVAEKDGITFNDFPFDSGTPDIISCFIGPPGGFSQEELLILKERGALALKLSDHRLRTELAATVLAGNIVQKFSLQK